MPKMCPICTYITYCFHSVYDRDGKELIVCDSCYANPPEGYRKTDLKLIT